jgi:subtilisin family serine protease
MTAAVLLAAGSLCTGAIPATAAPAPAPGVQPLAASAVGTVTLITGDKVTVTRAADGTLAAVAAPAAVPGRHVAFTTFTGSGGDVSVVPSDMLPLLGQVLDPKLFDVSELIRDGYDDAHAVGLPLIVQHAAGASGTAATADTALGGAGLTPTRELTSIHSEAVVQRRDAASAFGAVLSAAGNAALHTAAGPMTRLGTAAGELSGISHVWLDGKVKAAGLDWNLSKINAPAAWSAGQTGQGVTVAVLDTGIDTTHPDLAGQVTASVNFSSSADTLDHVGHGTFVAGTIAGTGAVSGGARKGVAYGAKLLNVKVLGDNGSGLDSDVIAGLQWAAQNGAKVANLSFGGSPTDGTDPASEAVDALTAQYGTLFVAAAGNLGMAGRITEPGAADAAMSVGATDSNDAVTQFESKGPRLDGALKPDIIAPGVGIVSDRATGTSLGTPVDPYYTRADGTSMATAHVAGAAALLAAAHPTWTAAQLKPVLQATSRFIGVAPPAVVETYAQGAGRVDVAAALSQQVVPDRGTFDFGRLTCSDTAPITRQVTLGNTGTTDVTYDLSTLLVDNDLHAVPAGLATLSGSQVTVPAGGTGTVALTLAPGLTTDGQYTGDVVATPEGGGVPLHLAIAFTKSDQCELHASAVGLDGRPTAAVGPVLDLTTGRYGFLGVPADAAGGTITLPEGDHVSLAMDVEQLQPDGRTAMALINVPELTVGPGDNHIVLDMRQATPFTATVAGRAVTAATMAVATRRTGPDGHSQLQMANLVSDGTSAFSFYAGQTTTGPVRQGTSAVTQYARLVDAAHTTDTAHATTVYDLAWNGSQFPADATHVLSKSDVEHLARIDARYHNLNYPVQSRADFEGRLPSVDGAPMFYLAPGMSAISLPTQRTEYVSPDTDWQHWFFHEPSNSKLDTQYLTYQPTRYTPAERTHEDLLSGPFTTMAAGQVNARQLRFVAYDLSDTTGDGLSYDNPNRELPNWTSEMKGWKNGQQIFDFSNFEGGFENPAPTRPATWRVERDINFPQILPSGGITRTVWTFHTTPVTTGSTPLPLLALAYRIPLDDYNEAQPGQPLPVRFDVQDPAGLPVTAVTVTYSTDAGTTWQPLRDAADSPGRFNAVLPGDALRSNSYVALHVTAQDADGNSIDQTLNQAVLVAR